LTQPTMPKSPSVTRLVRCFNALFSEQFRVKLVGGSDEPIYLPADSLHGAQLNFTQDYFNSALHEIAHWCVAGAARRKRVDYGYWYAADGRTHAQQAEFEVVEVLPQAIESILGEACGVEFRASVDNLQNPLSAPRVRAFTARIEQHKQQLLAQPLPERIRRLKQALEVEFDGVEQAS